MITAARRWLREGESIVELVSSFSEWPFILVKAKVDSGADRTSIDYRLCEAMGWEVVGSTRVRNSIGSQRRDTYAATIVFEDVTFDVDVPGADRSNTSHPMIIGRDLILETLEVLEEE